MAENKAAYLKLLKRELASGKPNVVIDVDKDQSKVPLDGEDPEWGLDLRSEDQKDAKLKALEKFRQQYRDARRGSGVEPT